jgi:hypothetical protein
MANLVLIEPNGTLKNLKTKEINNDILYKKCGFRVNDDFLPRHTWRVQLSTELYIVSLWGKKNGKANFENKYDLPPPLDKDLYFGTCVLVRTNDAGGFIDLDKDTWEKIYAKLFGGFEDIGDADEYSEDELENVDPALLTAHGYLKDDFVVSDKEAIENDSDGDTELTIAPAAKVAKPKTKNKAKASTEEVKPKAKRAPPKKTAKKIVETVEPVEDSMSELEEEVYVFSDEE